jgi:hypothetical protein
MTCGPDARTTGEALIVLSRGTKWCGSCGVRYRSGRSREA